jgi:predicted DNA repair protein MutK
LRLAERPRPSSQRLGRALVAGMPKLLQVLSLVGMAAMLWVGGHILLVGAHELGWDWPYDLVHDAEHAVEDVAGIGGVLAWLVNTAISLVIGLIVGAIVAVVVTRIRARRRSGHAPAAAH